MPENAPQEKQTGEVSSPLYNPNSEQDRTIQAAALHWELLRRNTQFEAVAERWIADARFRLDHSASKDYHHLQVHFPRCALDWMISGAERAQLARAQLSAGRWFRHNQFNFGPIVVTQRVHPLDVRRETIPDAFSVEPMPDPPPPVRVSQAWPDTPEVFRQQFCQAVHDGGEFQVVTKRVREAGEYLRWVAARLHRKDSQEKLSQIIQEVFALGEHLRDLAEFHEVTVHDMWQTQVSFKYRGVTSTESPKSIRLTDVICRLNNQPIDLKRYAEQHIAELVAEDHKANSTKYTYEGTHPGQSAVQIDFEPGEFTLYNAEIEYMTLTIRFLVSVRRRRLFSKFELEGQGRVFSFEPVDDRVLGKFPQIDVVELL